MLPRFRLRRLEIHSRPADASCHIRRGTLLILVCCVVPFRAAPGQRSSTTDVATVSLHDRTLFVIADPTDGLIVWLTEGPQTLGSGIGAQFDPDDVISWLGSVNNHLSRPISSGFTSPHLRDLDGGTTVVQWTEWPDSNHITLGMPQDPRGTLATLSVDLQKLREILGVIERLAAKAALSSEPSRQSPTSRPRMRVDLLPQHVGGPTGQYPKHLLDQKITGSALIMFVIDTTGRAERNRMQVLDTDHREFGASAQSVIGRTFFEPAKVNGQVVPYRTFARIRFNITVSF